MRGTTVVVLWHFSGNGPGRRSSNGGPLSTTERPLLPRTALILEDDKSLASTLTSLLEDERFDVTTSATLERARYILFQSTHPIGVVLLDLALLDGDSEPLLEELHRAGPRAPAVVITSAFANRAVPLAMAYGVPHVVKPFDVNVVAATVAVAYDHALRPRRARESTLRMRVS